MKFKVPHTYVLLICLILIAAISTWIIPAGRYARVEQQGREIIDPVSYHTVKSKPAGIDDVLLSFPKGLTEVADIIFYIFNTVTAVHGKHDRPLRNIGRYFDGHKYGRCL